jgi:hypothetical protein
MNGSLCIYMQCCYNILRRFQIRNGSRMTAAVRNINVAGHVFSILTPLMPQQVTSLTWLREYKATHENICVC